MECGEFAGFVSINASRLQFSRGADTENKEVSFYSLRKVCNLTFENGVESFKSMNVSSL